MKPEIIALIGHLRYMLFCHTHTSADSFQNQLFSKNSFRNMIRVSNILDPDQARHFVGPDLGPNCLQRFSADDTGTGQFRP